MHTCYKIYGYFEFKFFTYHLSSVAHSANFENKTVYDEHSFQDNNAGKGQQKFVIFNKICLSECMIKS